MNFVSGDAYIRLECTVNGRLISRDVLPGRRLLDFLREDLQLTGVKEGCAVGECGACTVILDGECVNSCLVPVLQVQGKSITTIEGLLGEDGSLHPLQQSFIDNNGVGCGFCTPGVILSAKVLLDNNPDPTDEEIREALSGNLCRCTGYEAFVDSVRFVVNCNRKKSD